MTMASVPLFLKYCASGASARQQSDHSGVAMHASLVTSGFFEIGDARGIAVALTLGAGGLLGRYWPDGVMMAAQTPSGPKLRLRAQSCRRCFLIQPPISGAGL
jgi:hypothetical protein